MQNKIPSRRKTEKQTKQEKQDESGNVLVIILLAVVLIGALNVAIQGSSTHQAHVDRETLTMHISEVQRFASEVERGIAYIMQNGYSESDIRFAHPQAHADYGDLSADADKGDQIFAREGGAAKYRDPPVDVNDGSAWEFYGNTALPLVGSDEPELIAVLPNVTQEFCVRLNDLLGYDPATQPTDTAACIYDGATSRFDDGTQFSSSPNTVNDVTFTYQPSTQGCAQCSSDSSFHYFYVIMSR